MLCNSKTEILHSEQLFGICLEVKVIRNWAINCKICIHMKEPMKLGFLMVKTLDVPTV